jgi:hypothetical protein
MKLYMGTFWALRPTIRFRGRWFYLFGIAVFPPPAGSGRFIPIIDVWGPRECWPPYPSKLWFDWGFA